MFDTLGPFLVDDDGCDTVDGRNPANRLSLVVYPIISRVLAPSQVVSRISEPSTV